MIIKGIKEEDFLQYKLPSMLVAFPSCTFKCEKECSCKGMCQNGALANSPNIEISAKAIVDRYLSNSISEALVCGGLEPFDTYSQLLELLTEFRSRCDHPVIIYTGFYKNEIKHKLDYIIKFIPNVIIKFLRIATVSLADTANFPMVTPQTSRVLKIIPTKWWQAYQVRGEALLGHAGIKKDTRAMVVSSTLKSSPQSDTGIKKDTRAMVWWSDNKKIVIARNCNRKPADTDNRPCNSVAIYHC